MAKFNTIEEAREFCKRLPVDTLVNQCAEFMYMSGNTPKIRITQEQFDTFFSIIGLRSDGTKETRGRSKEK